jgi:hypothetical protein
MIGVFAACVCHSAGVRPWLAIGILLIMMGLPASLAAQGVSTPGQPPLLGSTIDETLLGDLPSGDNPLTIPAHIQPEVVGTFFTPGLSDITPPRFGGLLNSWTQTEYRIGDVPITDPRTGGLPLLTPTLPIWERVTTLTGAMPVDVGAPAVSMTLAPERPTKNWIRTVTGSISGPALVAPSTGEAPVFASVREWESGNAVAAGPLTNRLGLVAAGSWHRFSSSASSIVGAGTRESASGFARLLYQANRRDEISAIGWQQLSTGTSARDLGTHVQAAWARRDPTDWTWRLFGGYTQRNRTVPTPSPIAIDTLFSDPISDFVDTGAGTTRRWTIGARVAPPESHLPTLGVDLGGAQMRSPAIAGQRVNELVGGKPARVWDYRPGTEPDVRQMKALAAFADEHWTLGRLTLDAGLRLERVSGAAQGAVRGIAWTNWLPRLIGRWQITKAADFAGIAAYRRSAYQLPLDLLAVGDPAAPVATVSSWNSGSIGPPIAHIGPGTGGDPGFVRIDPALRRPITNELVLALRAQPTRTILLQFARITKREQPILDFVDVGVPPSEYTPLRQPDPSFVPGSPVGAPEVTAFDRPLDGYGRDRYLLTNAGGAAKSWSLDVTIQVRTRRVALLVGSTLTWAKGPAAAIGALAAENDQDLLGSMFVDPNSNLHARGQLFQDRSHVAKRAGSVDVGWHLRVGGFYAYADGQPFARVVVVPDLVQGATPVRAYANGGSAFTYTQSIGLRVERSFQVGTASTAVALDVYNVPNAAHELSEITVSGPLFRTPTSLQPARTGLISVRISF